LPSPPALSTGRGLKTWNHSGNERLRELVREELPEYSCTKNRVDKSIILCRIIQHFRQTSPSTGGFVKQDLKTKRWHAVVDLMARATVAQAFRDALSSKYKSSKHSKRQRRWNNKPVTHQESSWDRNLQSISEISFDSDISEALPDFPLSYPVYNNSERRPSMSDSSNALRQMLNSLDEALDISDTISPLEENQSIALLLANIDKVIKVTENPFEPTPISPLCSTSFRESSSQRKPDFGPYCLHDVFDVPL